jgi:hypothetical protein
MVFYERAVWRVYKPAITRSTALIAEQLKGGMYFSRGSLLALTLASLVCGQSWAQLKGETLVATIPDGFKMGSQSDHDRVTTLEWVRTTESAQTWTEMVIVQIDRRATASTPPQVVQAVGKKWLGTCKGSAVNQIPDGQANGYPVSMLLVHCPLNAATDKPETTVLRVIKGGDALYSIQKTFRFEASNTQLGQIMKYLNAVNVCDTRQTDHPCPKID